MVQGHLQECPFVDMAAGECEFPTRLPAACPHP